MNPHQRRATALTSDQIAYVRGCQRLQLAVFNLTHKDPLKALSNKFGMTSLKKAILMQEKLSYSEPAFPILMPSKNMYCLKP